ncbi:hypothetical protein C461_09138 [Halorubrum aidingense JCM 13560]|uniref:Lipoprotein n=1 Tax=Halorubrum aidingense JCM 13560 TaxID=1230454 RepID=M0PAM4_9EURY|nr:hypothetical protein [Halorubrum aidingense]EMA67207.1 hypothetical protein C461_09138 [Halorubrum aidingense JCM 13560]
MKRRAILVSCGVLAGLGGCLNHGGEPTDNTSNTTTPNSTAANSSTADDTETDGDRPSYVVTVSREDVEQPDNSCHFEELSEGAQEEVENAVRDLDTDSDDSGSHDVYGSAELLDTECYNTYLEYDGQYYWTSIDAVGG